MGKKDKNAPDKKGNPARSTRKGDVDSPQNTSAGSGKSRHSRTGKEISKGKSGKAGSTGHFKGKTDSRSDKRSTRKSDQRSESQQAPGKASFRSNKKDMDGILNSSRSGHVSALAIDSVELGHPSRQVNQVGTTSSFHVRFSSLDFVEGFEEGRTGPLAPPARDPLAAARARGAAAKVDLLERAGGGLTVGRVADWLEITPAAVHARRQRGTLLAVPRANGEHLYPAFQFTGDGTLAGLGRVLQSFQVEGPWTKLSVLLSPADALDGRTPLDALRDGDIEGAVQAVSTYGEHLA